MVVGERVVLLDDQGRPCGTAPKATVHGPDTPLHLAFSSYLFDDDGRVLLTRRALHKRTFPGVWTNTCCGHPGPEEDPAQAVVRRVRQELGLEVGDLRVVLPAFAYRAVDDSGIVENEICPVYVGTARGDVRLDPDEVAETRWVPWADVVADPSGLSPWAQLQIAQLTPLLL